MAKTKRSKPTARKKPNPRVLHVASPTDRIAGLLADDADRCRDAADSLSKVGDRYPRWSEAPAAAEAYRRDAHAVIALALRVMFRAGQLSGTCEGVR